MILGKSLCLVVSLLTQRKNRGPIFSVAVNCKCVFPSFLPLVYILCLPVFYCSNHNLGIYYLFYLLCSFSYLCFSLFVSLAHIL